MASGSGAAPTRHIALLARTLCTMDNAVACHPTRCSAGLPSPPPRSQTHPLHPWDAGPTPCDRMPTPTERTKRRQRSRATSPRIRWPRFPLSHAPCGVRLSGPRGPGPSEFRTGYKTSWTPCGPGARPTCRPCPRTAITRALDSTSRHDKSRHFINRLNVFYAGRVIAPTLYRRSKGDPAHGQRTVPLRFSPRQRVVD